jgi:Family of unknown function (DUF5683)
MYRSLLLCVCVITGLNTFALKSLKTDSTKHFLSVERVPSALSFVFIKDSISEANWETNRQPRRATVLSAILPGAGQVYNRKYWKVPIIYAVAGGFGYLFVTTNKQYKEYKQALISRYDDDTSTPELYPKFDDANLVSLKKKYKRRRDMCAVGIGAVYLLNIIDANVDAHLKKFDEKINEKLSLSIRPCANALLTLQQPVYYSGLKFRLNF